MDDKIDNALKEEIETLSKRKKDLKEVKLEVIIVNKKIISKNKSLSELKSLVNNNQFEVISKLHQIGVKEKIKSMPLSNSICTKMTVSQAREISELSQVEKILLDKKQHVAL